MPIFGTSDSPGLMELVRDGRMVVPRFQRPWLWTHARSLSLVRSIARSWPAGALLLMEGDRGFPSAALTGVTEGVAAEVDYSILDGQQRLTALYLTLNGLHPRHIFTVSIGMIAHRGDALEEDFEFMTRRRWADTYPTVRDQAAAGVIAIDALVSEAQWLAWVAELGPEQDRDAIADARRNQLGGLVSYQFPVAIVSRHAPLEVLTSIFVTINQQGLRLSIFDLMVAKSWLDPSSNPPAGFDLRQRWNAAIGAESNLPQHTYLANFGIDDVLPLRLIKLLTAPTGSVANAEIVSLDGGDIRTHIDDALTAMDAT